MKTQPVMRPLKRRPSSPLSDVTCFEELAKIISDESDTDDSTPDSGLSGSGGEERCVLPLPALTGSSPINSPSPLKLARRRRRLLIPSPAETQKRDGSQPDSESSPPSSPISGRRLRQLTLFDSPSTPRSFMRKKILSERQSESPRWRAKGQSKFDSPRRSLGSPRVDPGVTINPFTPANRNSGKKSRVSIRAAATSRYKTEFIELSRLGQGEFGSVYKAVNRFDGCIYAIKKTKKSLGGKSAGDEGAAIREVCAHAVLGKHKNVVRYYSAWCELDRMIIQSEYCNGGSLENHLSERRAARVPGLSKDELKDFLRQTASGLNYIHRQELVHLDIKPGNIFRSFCETVAVESNFSEDISGPSNVTYKIGDLGHVVHFDTKSFDDGDCRYMSRELIDPKDHKNDLRKADVFALGLSAFESATLLDLPQNGVQWHKIRSDGLPKVKHLTDEINHLVNQMVKENPNQRPTSAEVAESDHLSSYMSNKRLQQLLEEEVNKNKKLLKELRATQQAIGMFKMDHIEAKPLGAVSKRMCFA